MQNIVITGGLGYIGCELCVLYSGEARFKNITVVDDRFLSERVKQLREWGINFIQASILDETEISDVLKQADVLIHLAGITDVAYVKTQSNDQQDTRIRETGIDGTRNIIKHVKKDCKIIFPSTHVVYEGFAETKTEILESEPPCPLLTYSTGKVESEIDLAASDLNYVILRLGSVYGYSTDTMRLGIMPNLFSKNTSQNITIKLFSGGIQLKSLVSVFDVARCMKFMAEREDIKRELFHLSKENMTVREVAELCKQMNPNLVVIETQDEIPNLGYTISNKKLLSTGFEFRYDIRKCIGEMIANWSARNINPALEYIDRGGNEFVDSRGRINNYELTEPINLIGYIESNKGTVRANHYHPIQEQKCLLIKGQYISVIKDLSIAGAAIETKVINEGDLAIIKPNVAHTMVFTEDSIFLNLVRGEREHENYGITHTISYKLVDEEMRVKLLDTYKTTCRCCANKHLLRVLSLGASPLANELTDAIDIKSDTYPLEMNYCPKCHNCQLSVVVPPAKMFDSYLYVSSTTASFREHFEQAADKYISELGLNQDSLVVDIGSNDGVALKPMMTRGIKILGIEPAVNIARIANSNNIRTLNCYFDIEVANNIVKNYGKAKLVTASNVFAHSDKLSEIAVGAFEILDEDGTFVVEVQYLMDTVKDLTFDNIYHEHTNYWSVTSINNFFVNIGFSVVKVDHIATHGGSIRVYIKRPGSLIDSSVERFLQSEISFGLTRFDTFQVFAGRVEKVKDAVRANIDRLKEKYGALCGYGAPAKATTSLNYYGFHANDLKFTVDDNPLKFGKYIPGVNIPIRSREYFLKNTPRAVIVLAWNFFDYIRANNQDLIDRGVVFINIKDLEKQYNSND